MSCSSDMAPLIGPLSKEPKRTRHFKAARGITQTQQNNTLHKNTNTKQKTSTTTKHQKQQEEHHKTTPLRKHKRIQKAQRTLLGPFVYFSARNVGWWSYGCHAGSSASCLHSGVLWRPLGWGELMGRRWSKELGFAKFAIICFFLLW